MSEAETQQRRHKRRARQPDAKGKLLLEWREPGGQLALLIVVAFLLGGGGVAYGLANLTVQLAALAVLAVNRQAFAEFFRNGPRVLAVIVAASCILPLLQLLPLPPSVWGALPGRDLVRQSLSLAGEPGWFPLSVDSGRTLVAFLGTIAPLAVICTAWSLSGRHLDRLQALVVILGVICAVVGAVQVFGGIGLPYPENPMPGVLFGSFANRNSAGVFLVCCLVLLSTLPLTGRNWPSLAMVATAGVILLIGVILTQSRSSIVLLAVPALLLILRFAGRVWRRIRRGRDGVAGRSAAVSAAIVLGCTAAGVGGLALIEASRVETSLDRFADLADDNRTKVWEDAAYSARRFWPVGAGMGTFDEVFQIDESLEYLTPRRAGRAHDDYLEIAIEAGLAGAVLVLAWLAWCLVAAARFCRFRSGWRVWGGAGVVACIALQSAVDYTLRNQTMLCIGALAIVLLARGVRKAGEKPA